ncbi:ArsC family reductase [Acidihalobacter ferrooxydans]|uniref:ArsC family reductase n=1 Tax=Acidihalobacter ferrooxydans TaxID=1765967 RepID=A0A1P8UHJ4_9GAMM|nr:ArsC family reductase [Acidihalobacter ferrooxydans]APZ43244.1 ArsC family reductase [Acidihalobacter ferrooxydans]
MTTTLYGITHCDTVRKARRWLDEHGVAYDFHDFRRDGIDRQQLGAWSDELGWEALLNRRGTTWRKLSDVQRDGIDAARALALMLEQPALIKRPVLDIGGRRVLGFDPREYATLFD